MKLVYIMFLRKLYLIQGVQVWLEMHWVVLRDGATVGNLDVFVDLKI